MFLSMTHNIIDINVFCFVEEKIERTFTRKQREHVGQKTNRADTYKLLDC